MCAASPARNRRPTRIGSATKLRIGVTLFSSDRRRLERAGRPIEPQPQLLPDPLVRPRLELLVRRALDIEPAARRRAHAEQGEAARMVGVDQLLRDRLAVAQDAEPAERVDPFEHLQRRLHRAPAHAVEAVAAGDEVTLQRLRRPLVPEPDHGRPAVEPLDRHVLGLEQDRAVASEASRDEVLGDVGLAVDRDRAPGQGLHVDAVAAGRRRRGRCRRGRALCAAGAGRLPPRAGARPYPARARRHGCGPRHAPGSGAPG